MVTFKTVKLLTLESTGTDYWVGAQQISPRGDYFWLNDKPFNPDLWTDEEPNDSNGASRACAYTYNDVIQLYDRPCSRNHGHICQKGM